MLDAAAQNISSLELAGLLCQCGDDEVEMVGQGLRESIEAALEWRTDDDRGEERVLDD